MKHCERCGAQIADTDDYCDSCYAEMDRFSPECEFCGRPVDDHALHCPENNEPFALLVKEGYD